MWSTIIGHDRQIAQLKRAIASGRLPNAYVFSGPSGIGKRLVANAFAAAIFCADSASHDGDACGACSACRKFASGNHPDFFPFEPESSERGAVQTIKIEPLRELQERLQYAPLEAKAKIAVIDGADRLLDAAANSLLKIIEEPPLATHFILITPYPNRLLPTIRSRSQHMSFSPLPEAPMAGLIGQNLGLSQADAIRVARLSGGSMGLAGSLDPEFIETVLGRFLPLLSKASSADIIETALRWKELDAERLPLVFDLLASLYRDILRIQATGSADSAINPESARFAGRYSCDELIKALAEIGSARITADSAANKQLMFEQLLFSLLA